MTTQQMQVLKFMERNGSITSMQAINEFRITRLAARIYELKGKGHKIMTFNKTTMTPEGKKTWAEYRLVDIAQKGE